MSQKLEYDAQLGGTVVLGDHVPTYRYAAAALQELRQMVDGVSQPAAGGGKLIFQTLPKHLRRRAMSHNPKRLPRKYRRIHIAQMAKSGAQRVIKRPSRKYRRRPKNLMQDYLRRQRRHAWLETHIWHARRFHMIDCWGYRLPHYSCDKMFRACYRAGAAHCLLQDISYYVCFELHGTISSVCEGICRLSNGGQTTNSSLSLKANTFISGQREGALDLFRDGQYPRAALGRATFMWRPLSDNHQQQINDETKRTLWLWMHACIYKDVASELIKVFEVKECEVDNNEAELKPMETNEELSEKARDDLKIKSASHTRGRSYENATNQMKLTILKDAMNRFRLTGPLSQSVLTHALETKNLTSTTSKDWFQQLSTADTAHHFQKQHKNQSEFWSKCQSLDSPSDLLPNFVLGLNVIDPRLKRPLKRTKAKTEQTVAINEIEDPMALLIDLPKSLSDSPIWQADIRQNVRENMMDTHTWCQMREKHALVPGSPCAFENQMQAMPLLLIQRPGLQERNMRLNYGCGWDLIVPAGYGLIVWLTLIMWGAKPGGLRESETLAREMGHELHLPDTVGGHQMANDAYEERRKKYFKLPQGKRSNYNKLAIVSPFRVPWSELVRDWLTNINNTKLQEAQPDFYVLRERSKLESLQAMLRGGGGGVKHQRLTNVPNHFFVDDHAVIQLRLRMSTRGNIGVNALICLPTQIDLKKQLKNRRNSTNDAIHLEPTLPDLNQKDRKMLKQQHQKELKRLRRRRYREKRKMQETATKRINIAPANTSALVAAQADKLQKLWLPNESCESLFSVRKQCSRETVGYVTTAGFSMAVGKVCAIGYVTANGFQALLNLQQKLALPQALCLVRDVNSPQYYLASFEVSMEL